MRGDLVTITGRVIDVLEDDPNYVNCTVLLDQQMPPSGMRLRVDCNTAQLVKTGADQQPPQPSLRLPRVISYRLDAERSAKRAALAAIGQSLVQARQMMQRLMQVDQQLRQFN